MGRGRQGEGEMYVLWGAEHSDISCSLLDGQLWVSRLKYHLLQMQVSQMKQPERFIDLWV